jgi:hypothetical protein
MKKLLLLLTLPLLGACFNSSPVQISRINPRVAAVGDTVNLTGSSLNTVSKILVGSSQVNIQSQSASTLSFTTPSLNAGQYTITAIGSDQSQAKADLQILAGKTHSLENQALVVFKQPTTENAARKIASDNQMTLVEFKAPEGGAGVCSKGFAVFEQQGGAARATQTASDIPEVLEANPHIVGTGGAYSDSGPTTPTQHKNEFAALEIDRAYTFWKSKIPTMSKRNPRVAVLDTGVSPHYDFRNLFNLTDSNLLSGRNFTSESSSPAVGLELDTADLAEDATGLRVGHGTAIAAIIGARDTEANTNFPNQFWQVGVLPGESAFASGADILPVKVCDKTTKCKGISVLAGICYAISQKSDVINLSLSTEQPSSILKSVLEEATNAGIVVVASAGNRGSAPHYPAAYSRSLPIIAVGSLEYNADTGNYFPSSFSVPGDWISVAAPGKTLSASFDSSNPTGFGYRRFEGTSFAAAWVSGVAAMQKALTPSLTPLEIRNSITSSATALSVCSPEKCGAGMVNVARAIGAP